MEEERRMKEEIRKQHKESSEGEKAGDKGEMEEARRMKEEIRKQKKETSELNAASTRQHYGEEQHDLFTGKR
ncbi:hypothetical protein KUCAC02_004961 [Chaenocephalus aceratus]|uniref:Uncharacterized protein n=1 Tax=Chaenocephalus aceratus TaxID=36190 RepID=A0ACB9X058_CHAAC|nr:hypothetical protein KUCAC02_004961 [Chaenocephalus aceratus]